MLLPVANTTAELIAEWLGDQLAAAIRSRPGHTIDTLRVDVEENFGQWAHCEIPLGSP